MPFIPHTPEALIDRSDSKNPATTCKGITASGRPCRRALAASASKPGGVLAVVSVTEESDAAAFFCWQHKDQAARLAQGNKLGRVEEETRVLPLKERTSIDTLVQRLGVLEIDDATPSKGKSQKERRSHRHTQEAARRVPRPPTWENVQSPVMSIPAGSTFQPKPQPVPHPPRPKSSFWAMLCCGASKPDDDYVEVVRHRKRRESQINRIAEYKEVPVASTPRPAGAQGGEGEGYRQTHRPTTDRRSAQSLSPQHSAPVRKPLGPKTPRPLNQHAASTGSPTSNLLSWIPDKLSPLLTSSLLAELSKPISLHDEAGYIYIFWLTPSNTAAPPTRTASTLLSAHPDIPRGRRASDVLSSYGGSATSSSVPDRRSNTILMKIGRASNVHRRMNEWTRQCGYELSLVRFYPHVSSSPAPSPTPQPRQSLRPQSEPRPSAQRLSSDSAVRKVPHAHRVERLIHIELAEKRVKKDCGACGKEHREWFEVDASMEGVRKIDEVIKRWVRWGEHAGQ